jgi:hypothetical protein
VAVRLRPSAAIPATTRALPSTIKTMPPINASRVAGQAGRPGQVLGPKATSAMRSSCRTTYPSPREPIHDDARGITFALPPTARPLSPTNRGA